jgi:hypothetical protein
VESGPESGSTILTVVRYRGRLSDGGVVGAKAFKEVAEIARGCAALDLWSVCHSSGFVVFDLDDGL